MRTCVYVCATCVRVPLEVRRGCGYQSSWNWRNMWLWAVGCWWWDPTRILWKGNKALNHLAFSPALSGFYFLNANSTQTWLLCLYYPCSLAGVLQLFLVFSQLFLSCSDLKNISLQIYISSLSVRWRNSTDSLGAWEDLLILAPAGA